MSLRPDPDRTDSRTVRGLPASRLAFAAWENAAEEAFLAAHRSGSQPTLKRESVQFFKVQEFKIESLSVVTSAINS